MVSNLAIAGLDLKNREAILAALASVQRRAVQRNAVAEDRDFILAQYQSAGYPDAAFEFHATPAAPHQMNLQYKVTRGQPQYVRDVLISGLHTTRRRLVDPMITMHSGEPLSWSEMG